MTPTDQYTLRADFVTQISAISPSHGEYQNQLWRPVQSMADVPGGGIRSFFVWLRPSDSNGAGIFGWGIERSAEMRVYTNYGAMADAESSIIDEDYLQLYHALQARLDPTVAGLIMVEVDEGGFQFNDDTPGHVWGYHPFRVNYLWRHTLNP